METNLSSDDGILTEAWLDEALRQAQIAGAKPNFPTLWVSPKQYEQLKAQGFMKDEPYRCSWARLEDDLLSSSGDDANDRV